MSIDEWYIHIPESSPERKGPYDTATMEDYARQGILVAETRVSHSRYTKGRVVEARRIARFFNIFANVLEENALTIHENGNQVAPIIPQHTERKEEVAGVGRFMADGQDPTMICKLAERVDGICTRGENALYMAVQQRPIANFSPDAVVLTNRRAIIFRQKVLGRLQFVDVPWLKIADVHLGEDILGSTISIRGMNGYVEQVSYLPKTQARKIYRIAQDMEEKMVELRRHRAMEETRAGATNVTVNNDLGDLVKSQTAAQPTDDPVSALKSLKSLKSMLEAGLIEEEEYALKKQQIMDRL